MENEMLVDTNVNLMNRIKMTGIEFKIICVGLVYFILKWIVLCIISILITMNKLKK